MAFFDSWERVKNATNIKNQYDLAEALGVSQPVVSKYKKKGEFPVEWAYKLARSYGLTTEWIMTGEGGPKGLAGKEANASDTGKASVIKEWVDDVISEEGTEGRIVMEMAFQVPEFRQWYEEKKKKTGLAEDGLQRRQNTA